MHTFPQGTQIRLFADDILLYSNILTPEDSAILQRDLHVLQALERENKLEFHPDKCQVLRITNKKSPSKKLITSITPDYPQYSRQNTLVSS